MDTLVCDSASIETSVRVKDTLRMLCVCDWQSEPAHQNQNPAERCHTTIKSSVNLTLNRTGAPAYAWLLCLLYVCFCLNHIATESIGWRTPLEKLTGVTPDTSPMLMFEFWEPVCCLVDNPAYPSDSSEAKGRFVGMSENVGHAMTFKVLTDDTEKVIHRSMIRTARNPETRNRSRNG